MVGISKLIKPITLLKYNDGTGNCTRKINCFNAKTSFEEMRAWISNELGISLFRLLINDPDDGLVDFTDGYNKSFRPYGSHQEIDSCGPQSTTSTEIKVELYVVQPTDQQNTSSIGQQQTSNMTSLPVNRPRPSREIISAAEPPTDDCEDVPSQIDSNPICAPHSVFLKGTDGGILFTKNVNQTIRDDYETRNKKPTTLRRSDVLINIQGDKTGLSEKEKYKSVVPMCRMSDNNQLKPNFVACLVKEVCKNGKRVLYHHPEHELVENTKKNMDPLDPLDNNTKFQCSIDKNKFHNTTVTIPFNEKMFSKEGIKIELKTKVVLHAKTYSNEEKHLFCRLLNQYPKNISYETTRLAILPKQDGELLWDQLILSYATIFYKSKANIIFIEIRDDLNRYIERIPIRKPIKSKKSKATKKQATSRSSGTNSNDNQNLLASTSNHIPFVQEFPNTLPIVRVSSSIVNTETTTCNSPNGFHLEQIQFTDTINIFDSSQTPSSSQNFNTISYQELPTNQNDIHLITIGNDNLIMDNFQFDLNSPQNFQNSYQIRTPEMLDILEELNT